MRKLFAVICIVLSVMISGCSMQKPTTEDSAQTLTIADYFPFRENTKYIYEGSGNEYASYMAFADFIEGNRIQLRTNNGGTESVKVIECKDGKLSMLLFRGEQYARENLISKAEAEGEILLMEPIVKGTSWMLSNNSKRYIANTNTRVTTPLGQYEGVEVITESDTGKTADYYVANVGLVKSVFYTAEGDEISSSLQRIESDASLSQTVAFYYPNVKNDKMVYVEKQLTFYTNDVTSLVLEKAYKDLISALTDRVFSANTKVNKLYLNEEHIVCLDLSKDFVTDMNAGAGYENMILQAITNTFGSYYGVNQVMITIDGNPYTSGHFSMDQGETFQVNTKGAEQIKG